MVINSMKKISPTSITSHIWSTFISLIFIIFLCLFLFQNLFYEQLYDSFKQKELVNVTNDIKIELSNTQDLDFTILESLALAENLNIAIFEYNDGIEVVYNPRNVEILQKYYDVIIASKDDFEGFREETNNDMDIFVNISKLNINNKSYFLYVSSPIDASNIALIISQYQIVISAVITILFGVFISYLLSKHLSKPIRDLNDAAFLLSNGNYDVTFPETGFDEIKELSNSLNKAKDELNKTNKMQQEFIANVSHDLRTPLTIISSYAEMIRDLSGDNKVKREEHLEVIISETNRLSSLVNDVLELTKLNANKQELNFKTIDISLLVYSVIDKLKLAINDNKINVITNIDKKAIASIDEVAFNQVVYNFLLNAITYTKTTITVNVNIIDNKIIFNVIDDGVGIKESELNKIWDRYYRSEENHERHKFGSGLGLSIVKTILDNHSFKYGVNSVENKGSNFYVEIPLYIEK